MQINRRGPGEASLTQDGRDLLDLLAVEASDEEFDAFLARLEQCLALREDMPRIAVTYREGLLGQVEADLPLQLVVVEEDPHDEPPLRVLRRTVPAGTAALDAMLAVAERRLQLKRGRAP
ncbi:hypothetical protein [Teichococcus aestuarii]|uniref:hypothetical protein n=1 Tax=Teichococcus aestuarii TaxID=568898 RepID=UPI003613CD8F